MDGQQRSRRSSAKGSFTSDRLYGYTLHWHTWDDFQNWFNIEQRNKGIQFVRKNKRMANDNQAWRERHEFLCSRQGGGSAKATDVDPFRDVTNLDPVLSRIGRKILDSASASHACQAQLSHLMPVLLDLEGKLDHANGFLPKKVPVAPNQHSWPETAAVMIARPKTKRKEHTDPYSGGERSGKRAKSDTRVAKTIQQT